MAVAEVGDCGDYIAGGGRILRRVMAGAMPSPLTEGEYVKRLGMFFWLLCCLPLAVSAAGPSLVLKDMDGNSRNTADFIGHGKWTVVAVWASDCGICRREIHQMASFHRAHRDKDATVLGVSIDGHDRRQLARAFVREHNLDFPNLIAELPQMGGFGAGPVMGTPTFYIYSPAGKLLAHQVGPVSQEQAEAYISRSRQKTIKGGG